MVAVIFGVVKWPAVWGGEGGSGYESRIGVWQCFWGSGRFRWLAMIYGGNGNI